MSEVPELNLDGIELEEARLQARLAKIAKFKELARELNISIPGSSSRSALSNAPPPPPESSPTRPEPSPMASASPLAFDGTFGGLIQCYRKHDDSPYHKLKYKVRLNYDLSLNRLVKEVGTDRIADWDARRVQYLYEENWAAGGKIAMGHTMVGKLRLLTSFGSVVLNDDACTRLSAILSNMRFPISRGRKEILSIDHARAIRATANMHFNWPSIALAQAIKFELPALRQLDVIGEWVPISEPGTSEIVRGNEKWVRGLRWSDIDDNLILRRTLTSGRKNQQKDVRYDLKRHAMIVEEMNRIPVERRSGPVIVCEYSNLPWSTAEFRRKWRIVADKAGVPPTVKNMDSNRVNPDEGDDEELRADTAL
jgi:hypothetical protein